MSVSTCAQPLSHSCTFAKALHRNGIGTKAPNSPLHLTGGGCCLGGLVVPLVVAADAEQEEIEGGEINLIPYLDIVTNLMLFLLASMTLLALVFPLMIAFALLVKIDSRGPVFYKQRRVGLDSRASSRRASNERTARAR